jgi:hypothetical protein
MNIQPNEKQILTEALHWYIDDRHQCAKAEEARSAEQAAEEHREAARRAGDVLNTLQEQQLQWSEEPPTEPGYYWYANPRHAKTILCVFERDERLLVKTDNGVFSNPEAYDGEWAGPIPEPVVGESDSSESDSSESES